MKNYKPAARWRLFLGYLAILATMLACLATGVGTTTDEGTPSPATGKDNSQVPIKLEGGAVEVQGENGEWTSVSGNAPLDVTAELESTDPWRLAGTTLQTDESTRIEEGLQAGELVRVQGLILENGTWLANSIERAEAQVDPIIILVGRADSTDPWTVNGIQLNVTEDTDIQGTITPGMFVRVEILLLPDGTWEVLSIAPLGETDEGDDCETVAARVESVNGNEIKFSGWPVITLDEDIQIEDEAGGDGTLAPGQTALITVCPAGEGLVSITKITVLSNGEDGAPVEEGGKKVLICHKPDKKGGHTISISSEAVPAHLAHGDTQGPCP